MKVSISHAQASLIAYALRNVNLVGFDDSLLSSFNDGNAQTLADGFDQAVMLDLHFEDDNRVFRMTI